MSTTNPAHAVAALACVPVNERHTLPLPLDVIEVLMADVLAVLPLKKGNPLNEDGSPVWCNGENMSEREAAETGAFWYEVAAGEFKVS